MEVQGGGEFYTKSRGVTCAPPPVLLSFDNLVRSFPFAFGPSVLSSFFPVKSLFLKASGNQTSSCLSLSKCRGGTMRQARLASQWTVNPTPSGPHVSAELPESLSSLLALTLRGRRKINLAQG